MNVNRFKATQRRFPGLISSSWLAMRQSKGNQLCSYLFPNLFSKHGREDLGLLLFRLLLLSISLSFCPQLYFQAWEGRSWASVEGEPTILTAAQAICSYPRRNRQRFPSQISTLRSPNFHISYFSWKMLILPSPNIPNTKKTDHSISFACRS